MPQAPGTCHQRATAHARLAAPTGPVAITLRFVHLTLLIPDLLPPADITAGEPAAPALRRIFSRGELLRFPAIDPEVWLCQAFEVERREDWPVAALTAAVDSLATDNDWWLRADPVHLQLQRHGTRVIAAPALAVDAAEAAELTTALNAHFATAGISVLPADPARWYIRQSESTAVAAPVLSAVAGRPLPAMPLTGTRASHWHRVLTEAQMILHDHPVNSARESRGLPAINSVLLWGGGRKPAVPGRHFTDVHSDDVLATALAVQSGADCSAAPASAALWWGSRPDPEGRHLITLNRVHHATRYGGPEAWIRSLRALEESWFAPLWAALDGPLQELVIVATGSVTCLRCTLRPLDRLKFWRRARDWNELLPQDS
ncbi:MAG: hypothetical protein AB7E73_09200 [Burkholderiales bacterium]